MYSVLQLFGHFVMLTFQVAFAAVGVQVENPLVVTNMMVAYIIDILCLGRPICLLVTRYASSLTPLTAKTCSHLDHWFVLVALRCGPTCAFTDYARRAITCLSS